MPISQERMRGLGRFKEGDKVILDGIVECWSYPGQITEIERNMRFIDGKPQRGNKVISMTIKCDKIREPIVITEENISQFCVRPIRA